jgi:hypothetical protein
MFLKMQFTDSARVSLFLSHFYKMNYQRNLCLNKRTAHAFSKFLRRSISALTAIGLNDVFSFQISPRKTHQCVAGNVSYGLSGNAFRYILRMFFNSCYTYTVTSILNTMVITGATHPNIKTLLFYESHPGVLLIL